MRKSGLFPSRLHSPAATTTICLRKAFWWLVRHRNGIYSVSFLHHQSPLLYEHEESWLKEMNGVVEKERKFRANGFVHGDLRFPKLIVCGDKLYLVDSAAFDCGGKEGDHGDTT
jgi:hypothetical protein